jgi:hypothetical protein
MKLHRGVILTKKVDINHQTNLETPPGGAFLGFLKVFLLKISKVVLGFRKFGYDF